MEWKIKASCHPGSFQLQLTIHPLIPYAFPPHQITHLQALGAAGNRLFRIFFQLLSFPLEPVLQHFRFGPYCRLLDIQSFECDLFSCESRLFNYCEISPELRLATNGISIFMNIQNELVHSRVPSFSVYLFGAESFAFTGLQ